MKNPILEKIGTRIGDTSDLPEDLLKELQINKLGKFEERVISIIKNEYENYANIDEILVGLYRKYQSIEKRRVLANKLYRMGRQKLIFPVKGKKGVYSTSDIDAVSDDVI